MAEKGKSKNQEVIETLRQQMAELNDRLEKAEGAKHPDAGTIEALTVRIAELENRIAEKEASTVQLPGTGNGVIEIPGATGAAEPARQERGRKKEKTAPAVGMGLMFDLKGDE